MNPTIPKDAAKKIRKLVETAEALKSREETYFSITRLTSIKSLCKDLRTAARFVTFLVERTWERAANKPCPSHLSEEEWGKCRKLMFEAVQAMRTHIDQTSEETLSVLWTLLNRVVAVQGDSIQRIHGKEVRNIRCWDVLIVEDALHCMLHPHAAGEIAYRTARDYTEKCNPSYGTGLIPESVPMLEDIIQFWVNHNFTEGEESNPVLADTSEGARKTKKRRGSIRKAQDVQTIRMVKVTAAGSFEDRYPKLADWVQDGWIEIGYSEGSDSFIRVIDEGGLVWEGKSKYSNVDEALKDAEEGVQAWLEVNT